ncbi:MAG: hypothetical protein ACOYMF_08280 [Bacteroidales bacterium]
MKDPYAKGDRKRQKEEKHQMRAGQKAWRRKHRIASWQRFRKSMADFFANPFVKKQLTLEEQEQQSIRNVRRFYKKDRFAKGDRQRQKEEKKQRNAVIKASRRRHKNVQRQEFRKRLNEFFSNPFSRKQLTPEELSQKRAKERWRLERAKDRRKLLSKVVKNPYRAIFPKKWSAQEVGYVPHQTKKDRKILAKKKRIEMKNNFRFVLATPDLRKKLVFTFLHSLAFYLLSFLLIYVIYQLATIFIARGFHIPVVWYYYRLKFPLYTFSHLYTPSALVTIFGSGPAISLLLALVFLRLFFNNNIYSKNFQLFYLWGIIHGLNMFFGAYIVGFLTRTEFIYTSEWLLMSRIYDVEEIIFTILSLGIMILAGRQLTSMFLVSSGSVTLVIPEYRLFFIICQVLLPWMAGGVIFFVITTPTYYIPFLLKTITPGLLLIPSLFTYNSLRNESIHYSGLIRRNYFRWSIVIVVIALLFFYRVVLNFGLKLNQ